MQARLERTLGILFPEKEVYRFWVAQLNKGERTHTFERIAL
jgi:hypothetical protein